MPVGGQTSVAKPLTASSISPSFAAATYTAASPKIEATLTEVMGCRFECYALPPVERGRPRATLRRGASRALDLARSVQKSPVSPWQPLPLSTPHGPLGVTQHGVPTPEFGQKAGLQVAEPP